MLWNRKEYIDARIYCALVLLYWIRKARGFFFFSPIRIARSVPELFKNWKFFSSLTLCGHNLVGSTRARIRTSLGVYRIRFNIVETRTTLWFLCRREMLAKWNIHIDCDPLLAWEQAENVFGNIDLLIFITSSPQKQEKNNVLRVRKEIENNTSTPARCVLFWNMRTSSMCDKINFCSL